MRTLLIIIAFGFVFCWAVWMHGQEYGYRQGRIDILEEYVSKGWSLKPCPYITVMSESDTITVTTLKDAAKLTDMMGTLPEVKNDTF